MSTSGVERTEIAHREQLRGGQMWSRVLKRGQILKLTDVEGGAAVAALFYNADDFLERYNMPDTLKAQHVSRLTQGYVLFSDMGRVLCSIVADDCGWHDTITGHADAQLTLHKYGKGTYQTLRNASYKNTHDNFLVELGKHGMGKRDIVANVNFFVKVQVDLSGKISWVPDNSKAGDSVSLRAELNTLVVLSNTPHPLDPQRTYGPRPVDVTITTGPPVLAADECRKKRPENARGFELTEDYFV